MGKKRKGLNEHKSDKSLRPAAGSGERSAQTECGIALRARARRQPKLNALEAAKRLRAGEGRIVSRVSSYNSPERAAEELAGRCSAFLVFSGSGMSAPAGVATFSDEGGIYEQARREHGLSSGQRLFTESFFRRNRASAQAFFARLYRQAATAQVPKGTEAIGRLSMRKALVRHFTMNVDGLHRRITSTYSRTNPGGETVEMHGSVLEAVCEECSLRFPMDGAIATSFEKHCPSCCPSCCSESTRVALMLYGDSQEDIVWNLFWVVVLFCL